MRELELMELIYKGIDPRTGEIIEPTRHPQLDKKRVSYLLALRSFHKAEIRSSTVKNEISQEGKESPDRPGNMGARWTAADDQALRDLWDSPKEPTAQEIASEFQRSEVAIIARLVKLEIFEDREIAREANRLRAFLKTSSRN